jgi:hypothetical protein
VLTSSTGKGYRHLTHGKMAEPHRATTLSLLHANGKALSDAAATTAAGAPTSCSWTASFVSGGGVYDELPANIAKPARFWAAAGTSSRELRQLTRLPSRFLRQGSTALPQSAPTSLRQALMHLRLASFNQQLLQMPPRLWPHPLRPQLPKSSR